MRHTIYSYLTCARAVNTRSELHAEWRPLADLDAAARRWSEPEELYPVDAKSESAPLAVLELEPHSERPRVCALQWSIERLFHVTPFPSLPGTLEEVSATSIQTVVPSEKELVDAIRKQFPRKL